MKRRCVPEGALLVECSDEAPAGWQHAAALHVAERLEQAGRSLGEGAGQNYSTGFLH